MIKFDPTKIYCNDRAFNEYNRLRKNFLNQDPLPFCNILPENYKIQKTCFQPSFKKLLKRSVNQIRSECDTPLKKAKIIETVIQSENRLKLRNSYTNSCYANSAIQCLMPAYNLIYPQVVNLPCLDSFD